MSWLQIIAALYLLGLAVFLYLLDHAAEMPEGTDL